MYYLKCREDEAILKKLLECGNVDEIITRKKVAFVWLRKLIILRREKKFIELEIFIYMMRLVLLVGNLKLIGHLWLHPVAISLCGLIQAFAVVFKSMRSKKNFCKLETKDLCRFENDEEPSSVPTDRVSPKGNQELIVS